MIPEISNTIALNYLGKLEVDDLSEWAVNMLEKGMDTPSLRILAGLKYDKPLFFKEVLNYFYKSIEELGYQIPEEKECILGYIKYICQKILEGSINPFEGLQEIYDIVEHLGLPETLINWKHIYYKVYYLREDLNFTDDDAFKEIMEVASETIKIEAIVNMK